MTKGGENWWSCKTSDKLKTRLQIPWIQRQEKLGLKCDFSDLSIEWDVTCEKQKGQNHKEILKL